MHRRAAGILAVSGARAVMRLGARPALLAIAGFLATAGLPPAVAAQSDEEARNLSRAGLAAHDAHHGSLGVIRR